MSCVPATPMTCTVRLWRWLVSKRVLGRYHLKVLASFGINECAPDPRVREQYRASCLWDEALDRLTTVLRKKGIVE